MSTTALVVVDAQEGYLPESFTTVRQSMRDEVRAAVQNGMPIVILEMAQKQADGQSFPGRTIAELMESIPDRYPVAIIEKTSRSGACQIIGALDGCDQIGTFRLIGGYVDGCLYATALGLQLRVAGSVIEIPVDASFAQMDDAWQFLFGLEAEPGDTVQFPALEPEEMPEMEALYQELDLAA